MSGSDGLVERLVVVARRLATDIVRARAVPLRRLHFELARELQLVPGALAAFEHDFQVIHPPVVAFCEVLHAHPHDQYDFDFSEAAHFDHCITVVDVWAKVRARGGDALVTAFERAGSEPIRLLLPLSAFGPKFLRLMGTAYHLQR